MAATVLVIDDDSTVRDSIAAYLADCDFAVLTADGADSAWQLLSDANSGVDAVVCDLKMPGSHGIELLTRIKQLLPSLPVVIVSGAGVMDDVVQALRLGAEDFLVKPILDLEVLHHALNKALHRVQLEQENQAYRQHLEKNNAELQRGLDELRSDQQAGRQAQLRMLPEALAVDGVQCRHRVIPSLMLSGDFLDYFEVGSEVGGDVGGNSSAHQLVFYIADVSGHGASSAFVTVLLKNLTYRLKRNFRRGSSDDVIYPHQVLARVNQELHESELDKHLTMFYGVLSLDTYELKYSVGGHFPMPILLSDEKAEYLQGRAMPVGLFKEAQYECYSRTLSEDFQLLLFSDGILEIMPEKTLNDKEQSLLAAAQASRGDLMQLSKILGIDDHNEVPDDIAMMSVGHAQCMADVAGGGNAQ